WDRRESIDGDDSRGAVRQTYARLHPGRAGSDRLVAGLHTGGVDDQAGFPRAGVLPPATRRPAGPAVRDLQVPHDGARGLSDGLASHGEARSAHHPPWEILAL